MLTGLVSLVIFLVILAVVYVIVQWAVGLTTIPAPLLKIVQIVFGAVALIAVLRYLLAFLK